MQRILLPGSYQGKKILIFEPKDSRTSSQPGAQQLPPEWLKVAGLVSTSHINSMPDVLGKFHLLCIPILGCQSAVTRPHISRACTSPGCQRDCWWDSAPACQSSLFLFSTRKIFWLRETKKPGQWWFTVKNFLLGLDIWFLTSSDPASPWVMSGYRIDRGNSQNLFCWHRLKGCNSS